LPLVDLLVDTKTELWELALRSGLKVFTAMLEEDRTALCGLRYAHEPAHREVYATAVDPPVGHYALADTGSSTIGFL
jgi:hypothetical protein